MWKMCICFAMLICFCGCVETMITDAVTSAAMPVIQQAVNQLLAGVIGGGQ